MKKNSITPSPHHPIESGRITVEMYKDPTRMVDEMSALGLRHVGYGIPTAPWNGMNFSVKMGRKIGEMLLLYDLNGITPNFTNDFSPWTVGWWIMMGLEWV